MTDSAQLHREFISLPVAATCGWYGTSYHDGDLQPCAAPTVGAGLFCDPMHLDCAYVSVCERHARNRKTTNWLTPEVT